MSELLVANYNADQLPDGKLRFSFSSLISTFIVISCHSFVEAKPFAVHFSLKLQINSRGGKLNFMISFFFGFLPFLLADKQRYDVSMFIFYCVWMVEIETSQNVGLMIGFHH